MNREKYTHAPIIDHTEVQVRSELQPCPGGIIIQILRQ